MKKLITIILLAVAMLPQANYAQPLSPKGAFVPNVYVDPQTGVKSEFFNKGYALIIANWDYKYDKKNEWADLTEVADEVKQLSDSLYRLGFDTVIVWNRTREQIIADIDNFIRDFGSKPEDRLLIYYTGHGQVTYDGKDAMGYIVPFDAPPFLCNANFDHLEQNKYDPYSSNLMLSQAYKDYKQSQINFEHKAVSFDKIKQYVSEMKAKQALLMFDCCFGGLAVSKSKRPVLEVRKAIQNRSVEILTAGNDVQQAPGRSTFLKYFLLAISGQDEEADKNGDDYLQTRELYDYLFTNVQTDTEDEPMHGYLKEEKWEKGEFVFVLPKAGKKEPPPPPPADYALIIVTTTEAGNLTIGNQVADPLKSGSTNTYRVKAGTYSLKLVYTGMKGSYNETLELKNGETRKVTIEPLRDQLPSWLPETVFIPGGSFIMGSSDGDSTEKPHGVVISDFYMGKTEITVAQFKYFIDSTGYRTDAEKGNSSALWNSETDKWEWKSGVNWKCDALGNLRPQNEYNHPVIHVSWNDATEYCKWLSGETGKTYKLPTEAQWEYAAGNGRKHTKYSWGSGDPSGKNGGNVTDESFKRIYSKYSIFGGYDDGYVYTAPVGKFEPNELGLYDMTGNVWEWCEDWYAADFYKTSKQTQNPCNTTSVKYRVIRGGSWYSNPDLCRVADRSGSTPDNRRGNLGFRLVLVP